MTCPPVLWPWHPIPGVPNLRTLGGYATPSGNTRRHYIYRSGAPTNSSAGAELKSQLGLKAVYDLRSQKEAAGTKLHCDDGLEYHLVPVFDEASWSPEAMATRWARTMKGDIVTGYRDILLAGATNAFRIILRHILERPDEPLLLHCTAGKDRTGVLCGVLLALVGVEDEVIAEEYGLTRVAMQTMLEGLSAQLKRRAVFIQVLEQYGEAVRDQGLRNMLGSEPETMKALLKILREEFGGPERYMREKCGFTEEEVVRIRENLLERQAV